jgi:hypothetical protein
MINDANHRISVQDISNKMNNVRELANVTKSAAITRIHQLMLTVQANVSCYNHLPGIW